MRMKMPFPAMMTENVNQETTGVWWSFHPNMIFKKIKKHVLQGGSSNRTSSIPPLSELSKEYVICCKFPLAQKFPHLADHQNLLGTLKIHFTPFLSLFDTQTHKHTKKIIPGLLKILLLRYCSPWPLLFLRHTQGGFTSSHGLSASNLFHLNLTSTLPTD